MNAPLNIISFLVKRCSIPGVMLLVCIAMGCGAADKGGPYPTPSNYDLNHPYKLQLSAQMDEISGIAFYPKDTTIFAIEDEEGYLFKIYPKKQGALQKWKFGKKGDYEDVAMIDSLFYVLKSNGDITKVTFISKDSIAAETYVFPEAGNNEFESMYYDKSAGTIEMLCKDCAADKKKTLSIWSFHLRDHSYTISPHVINVAPIAKTLGENKVRFKPSATAINPLTQELYMLSSVNKVLVIADTAGTVTQVYPLDPKIFAQPEGLAFTPAGDMLISNEINTRAYANILLFKNKHVSSEKNR
jgi:uncharacterized protein YjiK